MSEEKAACGLCGEPMPPGEEMFNYHGYSGPCPKPTSPKPALKSVIEYYFRNADDGTFWIDVHADRHPHAKLGPFESDGERQRAHDDLMKMQRSHGAIDVTEQ